MAQLRSPPTESQMLSALEKGLLQLLPLRLAKVERVASAREAGSDAIVHMQWGKKTFRFAVECKATSSPKVIDNASAQARAVVANSRRTLFPLVYVPYLSDEQLTRLENDRTSAIDLCGNGIVVVPDELFVKRSGQPNRFYREGTIKNIYRGSSSLAARMFLIQPEFDSVGAFWQTIQARGGNVTMATVSKVATALERDLIIERRKHKPRRTRQLRLIQPEKLLDRLTTNFVPARIDDSETGKLQMSNEHLARWSEQWEAESGQRLVRTGADSVSAYAVMVREPLRRFYCTDLPRLLEALGASFRGSERFGDTVFQQARDETVYFDRREELTASPLQTYLELMAGDKRDQETAAQIRSQILGP